LWLHGWASVADQHASQHSCHVGTSRTRQSAYARAEAHHSYTRPLRPHVGASAADSDYPSGCSSSVLPESPRTAANDRRGMGSAAYLLSPSARSSLRVAPIDLPYARRRATRLA